ncbi:MAG: CheR family methyltransferase [Myxococcales bacterium]|jgi:chemotaxis protein methyltransferase CheR
MQTRWSDPAFEKVAAIVTRHAGLKLPEYRYHAIELAVRKELSARGLRTVDEYAALLERDGVALSDLVSALTVGESYFFRDEGQFALIRERIVPELLRARPHGHVLRVWSAGCAGGEEPYSLAMLFEKMGLARRASILATDISRPALEKALRAVYSAWSLRGASMELARNYVRPVGKGYQVLPRFRDRVRFEYLNLAEDAYPSIASGVFGMDLILCRNVLIYFERPVVASVARRLFDSLAEGGWLLLGVSDPRLGQLAPFEVITTGAGLAYRRPAREELARREKRAARGRPAPAQRPKAPEPQAVSAEAAAPPDALQRAQQAYGRGNYLAVIDALRDEVDSPEAAALFVHASANAGDFEEAEKATAIAAERHPLTPELHLLCGFVLAELGRDEEAIRAARRALYLDRGLVVAHFTLGHLFARRGDRAAARRAFKNALRIVQSMPEDALVRMGDGERAGRLAQVLSAQLSLLDSGRG